MTAPVDHAAPATGGAGTQPVLQVEKLATHFPIRHGVFRRIVGWVKAVDGVDLHIDPNETLGVVGESGCGKTTLGRSILRLIEPTSGRVTYKGEDIIGASKSRMRELRAEMQVVFQDPFASLNPRMPVNQIIAEPMQVAGMSRRDIRDRVGELLKAVGLAPEHGNRYPHEFSGGQRQRIGIARALALRPTLIILDEPVSALDVSIQAQVINLLEELQEEFDLSYMFIAHDLSVVRHISDRVAVMYLGRIVEVADRNVVYENPAHPYTASLLSAVPVADPRIERARHRIVLEGDLPSPASPPSGCHFRTRCPVAQELCAQEAPELIDIGTGDGHQVSCHFPLLAGETLLGRIASASGTS